MKIFSHLWQFLAEFFLGRQMFQIKVIEKIKTHFMLDKVLVFFENYAVFEILSKNLV